MPPKDDEKPDDEKPDDQDPPDDEKPDDEVDDDDEPDPDLKVRKTPAELTKRLVDVSAENKRFRQEKAKLKKELEDERGQRKSFENDKLKEQGKFKELADKKEKEAKDWQTRATEKEIKFASKTIRTSVELEAARLGCRNISLFMKVVDLNGLEVDEDYNVSPENLKAVFDEARKDKDVDLLFRKKSAKIIDGSPASDDDNENKDSAFLKELKAAKTQRELDAVRTKYGRV
jgi:hypothetical protein